ncbi:MAG: hypothetical protein ACYTFX_00400, partial [Planctomycetota bacterium]
HEAGHALVQSMIEDADPLHKVSIIPRGPMGGATFALPVKDRLYYSKKYCLAELQVCFGGRVAEELFCDDITSGAQSDITQATQDTGPETYYSMGPEYSQKTAEAIDREVKRLINNAYTSVTDLIKANTDKMEALAKALLKYETLDAEEVKMVLEGKTLDKPTVSDLLKLEQEKTAKESAEAEDSVFEEDDDSLSDNPFDSKDDSKQ